MRKFSQFFVLLFASVSLFWACDPGKDLDPRGRYENGVIVVNEGNFFSANGNLGFYDLDSNKFVSDIFKRENNNVGIAATIQNITEYNGKLYIVTNAPNKVEITDVNTLKSVKTIDTDLQNPYHFAAINNKGYVSNWGTFNNTTFEYDNPSIKVIDLTTNTINKTIARTVQPQGLLMFGQNLYIANVGGNTVTVLNTGNDQVVTEITVSGAPDRFLTDGNNKIWVMCNSGNLVRINPATNAVEATISNIKSTGYNAKIAMNTTKTKLYWFETVDTTIPADFVTDVSYVYEMSITATTAPTTPLITGTAENYTGIGVNPANGQIYVGMGSFSANGKVKRYQANGTFIAEMGSEGIGPNGFLFR
jgi:YVTN family beta-propeller protein